MTTVLGRAVLTPYCAGVIRPIEAYRGIRMSVSIRSLPLAAFAVLAGVAIAVVTTPTARAFTLQDGQGGASGSNWRDLDLPKPKADEPDSRFKSENGLTTFKQGNSTIYFGSRPSFDQKYNPSNLFDPYARDGRQ
jgi:hypothetical protein